MASADIGDISLQFFQFGFGLGLGFLGHLGSLDLLFQLVQIGAFFHIAQFFLDRLDLLVQVILALALFHLALDAATDALFDLENIDLRIQHAEQVLQAFVHRKHFQHFLFLLDLERQMGGDGIGQTPRLVDAGQ